MSDKIISTNYETMKHRQVVQRLIFQVTTNLSHKALNHDGSKMQSPEVEIFAEFTPRLKESTYGSEEYKGFLKEMGKALDHHYEMNRHHPEHFKKYVCNGCFKEYQEIPDRCGCGYSQFQEESDITQMNLVDLIEMLCDWKAATMRHDNGDLRKSLEINKERFKISDDLAEILLNTAKWFGWV